MLKRYNVELLGAAFGLQLLMLWYLSSLVISEEIVPKTYDYFIQFVIVLTGAWIGAWSAFRLKESQDKRKIYQENKAALNVALFHICHQRNVVANVVQDFAPYTTPEQRAFALPALMQPNYEELAYDLGKLAFLLESSDPNIMMDLAIEQKGFEQLLASIVIRNNFYVQEVQPAMFQTGTDFKHLDFVRLKQSLTPRIYDGAVNGADTMYLHMFTTEERLENLLLKLRELARTEFPGEKFVNWSVPEKE
ncbi:hypothetical protein L8R84_01235 [Vibrio splendidus]|uniref:hypothetical protein n=1 Tax=Vibrio TaxID=662 RepID=UPI000C82BB74|nr:MULTISPECIES: hypothetical protein [Vibrio]MDH5934760.1 hypothetical protein [Vibrio splendidus]PMJ59776.1 hypothetical protein BCU18_12000 [Vibrio lentus]